MTCKAIVIILCAFTLHARVSSSTIAADYGGCLTATGEKARCIELEDCNYLYGIITRGNMTGDEVAYLRHSQCGQKDGSVLICCANYFIWDDSNSAPGSGAHLLPKAPQCGFMVSNRIYFGKTTAIDEFPWMGMIEYTQPGNVKQHRCGATLINNRYMLTAAHCVNGEGIPSDWRLTGVRLGEWDTTTDPDCLQDIRGKSECAPAHVDIAVEESISHPQFAPNSTNVAHDIALLRLAHNVSFNDFVRPICLPRHRNQQNALFHGTRMDISGWGSTEFHSVSTKKRKTIVSVWDLDECRNKYQQMNVHLLTTQMCAGGADGEDTCFGDSGGPLMAPELEGKFGAYMLTGIVSFGPKPCGLNGWPGVYTRVGPYVSWIENTIRP